MASTRMEISAEEELRQLKTLVAEQQVRLDALEVHGEGATKGDEAKTQRSTRRQLLKLAGATLAGAAGSAALRAIPAAATDGQTMQVGLNMSETAGSFTAVNAIGSANANNSSVLAGWAQAGKGVWGYAHSGIGVYGQVNAGGTAVYGGAFGTGGTGVRGYGTLYGGFFFAPTSVVAVLGISGSDSSGELGDGTTGVAGRSYTGTGVYGYTSNPLSRAVYGYTQATYAIGVSARSINGLGVFARGTTGVLGLGSGVGYPGVTAIATNGGPDLLLNGYGRLVQYWFSTGGTFGGPNFTPRANYFETLRTRDGAMWQSRGNGTGATGQAAWKRVNAVRVDSSDGTGVPFKPVRVIDTRSGAIKAKNSTTVVIAAPFGAGTSNIPSDAVAIIGNLTAVNYTGSGFLAIMPAGVVFNPAADPSSVNFIVGQKAIANGFVVGLNGGQVQVYVAGHASHFIIDVTGYIQ